MFYAAYSRDFTWLHVKELPYTFPKLYLACGATMIRTAGSVEPYSDLNLKRDIDRGKILGPAMDVTAPYLEGKGSIFPGMHELSGPAEAKAFVDFWASQGCTSFKGYMFVNKPTLKAAIDEAHAKGLKVTGHLCAVTYREAAEMGIDQLEHGFSVSTDFVPNKKENACPLFAPPIASADSPKVKELIQFLIHKKVILTSTLAVIYNMTTLDTEKIRAMFAPELNAAGLSRSFNCQQLIHTVNSAFNASNLPLLPCLCSRRVTMRRS